MVFEFAQFVAVASVLHTGLGVCFMLEMKFNGGIGNGEIVIISIRNYRAV